MYTIIFLFVKTQKRLYVSFWSMKYMKLDSM